ncbi:hypothetical protein Q9V03_000724 [Salmonella enterica]|nr:hypothetical protein [Salmonella enterica]ECO7733825.1 hypothetical protein [Salmonella enterica]EDZ7377381.1 hypothetical protein [Salmonella enterica]EEK5739155.1 hypothetical protein [Salmonella enterica]EEL9952911.1 hypothetical protein [Salmonella enterica]
MATPIKARDIVKNINKYKGDIIGVTIRGAGSQWVRLVDARMKGVWVELTVKMCTHNAHMGIRTKKLAPEITVNHQRLESWLRWCAMYGIETNHEFE